MKYPMGIVGQSLSRQVVRAAIMLGTMILALVLTACGGAGEDRGDAEAADQEETLVTTSTVRISRSILTAR